jgi:hypothetical protein
MSKGIYIIEDEPKICKIGYAKESIKKRVSQISGRFHRDFKLRGVLETEEVEKLEKLKRS